MFRQPLNFSAYLESKYQEKIGRNILESLVSSDPGS
jgi:hypothetical protein